MSAPITGVSVYLHDRAPVSHPAGRKWNDVDGTLYVYNEAGDRIAAHAYGTWQWVELLYGGDAA